MEAMNWMRRGEMVALGWTLLHFCWQGTALAMLYAAADRISRGASKNARYLVGVGTLALMTLALVLTFVEQERLLLWEPRHGQDAMVSELGRIHGAILDSVPIAVPAFGRGEVWIAWNADRILPWVAGIWLAGVLLLAFRAVGGWWRLQQIRRDTSKMIPAEVKASFERVATRLRTGRKVALYVSDEVVSPLAMGVWRAAVILPVSAVMQLSPAQLEAVLAHEMAHIRRWDYLGNLLQTAVECLLFFHPAVWWVSRRTRDVREFCCDEVAARTCADPAIYVEALLRMEEQRGERLQLATALHGRGGSLLERVKQLLGEETTMEHEAMYGVRLGAVGTVVLALILGPAVASGHRSGHTGAQPPIAQNRADTVTSATPPTVPPNTRKVSSRQRETSRRDAGVAAAHAPAVRPPSPDDAASTPSPHRDERKDEIGRDYLDRMRDAGYVLNLNQDLDTIIAMRSMGVTADFAKAMAQAGLGTPTLHDLIGLKAVGVTPDYVAGLKSSSIPPRDFRDVISEKSLGVTPEYARAMAAIGLGTPTAHDLVGLKAQGITPEYVSDLKAAGIAVKDLRDLAGIKAVGVTPEYAKAMSATGFSDLSTRDLTFLRAQGVTPEYARWLKQAFPEAEMRALHEAAAFHVDADFAARARSHGFNGASLDKLLKLKMSGLLD